MLEKNQRFERAALLGRDEIDTSVVSSQWFWWVRVAAQFLLMALVLGVALGASFFLWKTRPEPKGKRAFRSVFTIDTQIAKKGDFQPIFRSYGEIAAAQSADLRSLVAGTIIWVNPKLKSGGNVEQGEDLIRIDKFSYEGQLRGAKANRAEAKARIVEAEASIQLENSRLQRSEEQLGLAQTDFTRIRQLRQRGTATQKQLDDRRLIVSQRQQSVEQSQINITAGKARLEQLRASLDRLEWQVEQSQRDLENTVLRAPFGGTIRSTNAATGRLVNANDIVVSMYQADRLEARFVITDEQFSRIQADGKNGQGIEGRKVKIIWSAGGIEHKFFGHIDRIGAEIASARGGIEIYAIVGDADQTQMLRPGAFVEIRVPDRLFADHFKLPDSAVYGGDTIYLAQDGELVERKVTVAGFDGEFVLIGEGLSEGEEVSITRIAEISAGLKVRKQGEAETQGKSQAGQEGKPDRAGQRRQRGQRQKGGQKQGQRRRPQAQQNGQDSAQEQEQD